MPKPKILEKRNDFSGGLNVSATGDTLNDNELLTCVNARVEPYGGIMRRMGSKKLATLLSNAGGHANEAMPVLGIQKWQFGGGNQMVACTSDDLGTTFFYSNSAPFSTWVEVTTVFGSMFGVPSFAPFRDATPGAPLVLYVACNGLFKWTGTVLSQVVNAGGPVPMLVKALGVRLFVNDGNNPKTLWWSQIGVGDVFVGVGGLSGPGNALVDTLNGDSIIALETLGGSLFIGTNESIARFSGTGDDIQITQDSQGVSTEIGPSNTYANPPAMARFGQFLLLHSERGVFVATEGGVLGIGSKIEHPSATSLHMSKFGDDRLPIVGNNRRRNEAWFAYVPVGGTKRTNVLVYNHKMQCWYGPFIYNFGITCFGEYEHDDGIESILAGCDDGCLRLLDDLTATEFDDGLDDFDCVVEFAPFGTASGPFITKSLEHIFLQIVGELTFTVTVTGELGISDVGVIAQL